MADTYKELLMEYLSLMCDEDAAFLKQIYSITYRYMKIKSRQGMKSN